MKYCVAVTSLLAISAASSLGADWPQWRGPNRNAISKESGLLREWPQDGPSLAWRITGLGGGYSAPSISAGRMFGMSNRGDDEVVWALAERDGSEQWATRLGPAKTDGMPQGREGPGCTPTVDGDRLYVLGAGGALACLRVEDGTIIWQRSLTDDFGGLVPTWRYNESPLIDGDKLICSPGGPDATLVALDKTTGKTIWKSQVPDAEGNGDGGGGTGRRRGGFGRRGPRSGVGYASAIAIDVDGRRQYAQLTASTLVGVAASDGEVLWRYDQPSNTHRINCSTPLYHDGLVFAASGYGNGGGAVKLKTDASGAVTAEEAYFARRMQNHHGGMIVFDGALYGTGSQYLICLDFQTGDLLWQERRAKKGSLALADERLYLRTEDGTMILIEANAEEYVECGRFEQPERSESPAWTHPVIANGRLYVRDQDLLLCYDVKAK